MNKEEIVEWFINFIKNHKEELTIDWLRAQKLTFECLYEMRK